MMSRRPAARISREQSRGRRDTSDAFVGGRVAESTSEEGAGDERRLLERVRHRRQPDDVEEMVRDPREPQRPGHALPVRLAVGGEPEHRLDDATAPPGSTYVSKSVYAPSVSREVSSNTSRSPVTGLTIESPARIICVSFLSSGV